MKKIIVTGGNGFIGRHLVKKLLSTKPYSVVLISNSSNFNDKYLAGRKSLQDTPLKFYTADIRNREAISSIFRDERAETCIHLAAKTSVVDSIKNPDETLNINVNGTINVLEACYDSKVENFLFASSAAVYGDVEELPIKENSTLKPLSPYGLSKMLAEGHVISYKNAKKIKNAIMLRIFNVFGQGQQNETDVISKFAGRLSKGLPPMIYGDGMQTRDFISLDDVVDAIMLSIRSMEREFGNSEELSSPVFNIGTGIATSVKQIAQKMVEIAGLELEPIHVEVTEARKGILHSYADITEAKKKLHFIPKKKIDVGLRDLIQPQFHR